MEKTKIGRVVEIEGLNIIIEINEKEISEKINFKVGNQVTPVLINKLISIALLNGKELIGKIEKIVENLKSIESDDDNTTLDRFSIEYKKNIIVLDDQKKSLTYRLDHIIQTILDLK